MSIDSNTVARLRAETPGCEHVVHLNNAGASLMPQPVYDAVVSYLELERDTGGYEARAAQEASFVSFYDNFARLLNVDSDEIAYVENATRAWDMAFYALPLKAGDRIITHAAEYASSYLSFLQLKQRIGIEIDIAPSDSSGQIDVASLPGLVTPKTRAINLVHVPTQGGLVNPAAAVGEFAREYGLFYVLDACQSVGQLHVDVAEIGCHLLSGTGRKFLRGPRGTGFLYVASDILPQLEPPFIDMRAATWTDENAFEYAAGAQRFENWESFCAGRVGLSVAVEYALQIGLPNIEARVVELGSYLRNALAEVPGVTVQDLGERHCGIVTFTMSGLDATALAARLRREKINVSVTDQASARLDLGVRQIDELLRASVHYFNTTEELDRICEVLRDVA